MGVCGGTSVELLAGVCVCVKRLDMALRCVKYAQGGTASDSRPCLTNRCYFGEKGAVIGPPPRRHRRSEGPTAAAFPLESSDTL